MNSMTGFGRGSATTKLATATVEIAGVNRKQAEVVVQGIREYADLEDRIRKNVLSQISRGRLQINVTLNPDNAESGPTVDLKLAEQLEKAFADLSSHLDRKITIEATDFMRVPGIINLNEANLESEQAWEVIEPALEEALNQLLTMRKAEGDDLTKDMLNRISKLESLRHEIGEVAPSRPENYRKNLMKRLSEAGLELDLDDERVVREISLFADRCDITEELTRLDSHFGRFRDYLKSNEPVGRSLDFLCQEIHREFNTIGSKASDAIIAQQVVASKTELEKVREQVQNLE